MVFRLLFRQAIVLMAAVCLCPMPSVARADDISDEQVAQYLQSAIENKDQVLYDYRTLLEVYYEYKLRSAHPQRFANPAYQPELAAMLPPKEAKLLSKQYLSSISEFSNDAYNEFKAELDADSRLRGNIYRAFMRSYGGSGRDNDVLQRLDQFYRKVLPVMTDESFKNFQDKIGESLEGVATSEGRKIFARTSKEFGYPRNRQVGYQATLRKFESMLVELKNKYPFTCPEKFKKLAK